MTAMRRLSFQAILYAIGTTFQRIGSLFLVPIYTAALTTTEYGAVETLTVMVQTAMIVVNFGLSSALLRFYSECEDKEDVYVMVRTSSALVLILSVILFAVLTPFADPIGILLFKENTYGQFVLFAFAWAIGGALNQQLFAYYRARQEAKVYVALSIGIFLLLVAFNVYFVRFLRMGVLGVLLGNLIVVWGTNVVLAARFWRAGFTVSTYWSRRLLKFGAPLIFSMFGWLILNSADRYFLAYYRNLSEVGLYSLGYKVGLAVKVAIIMPFQLAWGPFVFERIAAGDESATQQFARVLTYLLLAFSLAAFAVFLFAPEIVEILGSGKFPNATGVIPFVLVAYMFNGIYYWAASLFHLREKTGLLSIIVFSMAGLNLLLNWMWIPIWGWQGAAFSTVISIGGTGLLTMFVGEYLYRVPLQWMRISKLAAGIMIIAALYFLIPIPSNLILGWSTRIGLLLSLPLILYVLGFPEASELRFVFELPGLLKRSVTQMSEKPL